MTQPYAPATSATTAGQPARIAALGPGLLPSWGLRGRATGERRTPMPWFVPPAAIRLSRQTVPLLPGFGTTLFIALLGLGGAMALGG